MNISWPWYLPQGQIPKDPDAEDKGIFDSWPYKNQRHQGDVINQQMVSSSEGISSVCSMEPAILEECVHIKLDFMMNLFLFCPASTHMGCLLLVCVMFLLRHMGRTEEFRLHPVSPISAA